MATIAGKKGFVSLTGTTLERYCYNWTIDFAYDALEDTNWDWSAINKYWRSFITGLQGWSGSFDCRAADCIDADFLTPGPYTVTFYVDYAQGSGFQGSCIITGITQTAPIDGIQALAFTFQGNRKPTLLSCATTTTSTTTTTTAGP